MTEKIYPITVKHAGKAEQRLVQAKSAHAAQRHVIEQMALVTGRALTAVELAFELGKGLVIEVAAPEQTDAG